MLISTFLGPFMDLAMSTPLQAQVCDCCESTGGRSGDNLGMVVPGKEMTAGKMGDGKKNVSRGRVGLESGTVRKKLSTAWQFA